MCALNHAGKEDCLMGIDWPSRIQALGAVAIVFFTGWTLRVLREYARDTKKIAETGIRQTEHSQEQIEQSQMPFLTVAWREREGTTPGGWEIQNQGFGPAMNIRFFPCFTETGEVWRYITNMAKGAARTDFHNHMDKCLKSREQNRTFTIEYSSLSGMSYRTAVDRLPNGELQTQFHKAEKR